MGSPLGVLDGLLDGVWAQLASWTMVVVVVEVVAACGVCLWRLRAGVKRLLGLVRRVYESSADTRVVSDTEAEEGSSGMSAGNSLRWANQGQPPRGLWQQLAAALQWPSAASTSNIAIASNISIEAAQSFVERVVVSPCRESALGRAYLL